MRKGALLATVFTAACLLTTVATGQPPVEPKGGKGGDAKGDPKGGPGGFPGGGKGGPGGFGMRPAAPGEIMPAFMQDQLKMTDEQKKQFADLQKDVDAKIEKLLTDDQKAQLKQMKERGTGRGGFPGGFPGGPGAPGGGRGGPGAPGGKGGPAPKGPDKQ